MQNNPVMPNRNRMTMSLLFRVNQCFANIGELFFCCCWLGHLKMSFFYPTSHWWAGGSIRLVHYTMIILKPAILELMAVVRYDHIPIVELFAKVGR